MRTRFAAIEPRDVELGSGFHHQLRTTLSQS